MGWLWTESRRTNRRLEAHQVRESERTSRQMERQNPVHQTPPICPLKMLFLLCSGSLAGLSSAKGMLKMPTHFPCQLGLTFCLNLCGILIRAREREKGRERARSSAMCLFFKGTNPIFRAPLPWPDYLSTAPPPNTITLGIRASVCECGVDEDTNIQSIAAGYKQRAPSSLLTRALNYSSLEPKTPSWPTGKAEERGSQLSAWVAITGPNRSFQAFPQKGLECLSNTGRSGQGQSQSQSLWSQRSCSETPGSHSSALASSWPWFCGIFPDITGERFKDQNNSTQGLVHIRTWGACQLVENTDTEMVTKLRWRLWGTPEFEPNGPEKSWHEFLKSLLYLVSISYCHDYY